MADEPLKNYVLRGPTRTTPSAKRRDWWCWPRSATADDLAEVLERRRHLRRGRRSADAPTPTTRPTGRCLPALDHGAGLPRHRRQGRRCRCNPGPGLMVIAGRNGSGKSTLRRGSRAGADGHQLALERQDERCGRRTGATCTPAIRRRSGSASPKRARGTTTIGVDWPSGDDVAVDDMQGAGCSATARSTRTPSVLGWARALEMYRPLLSYDELGGILEGTPERLLRPALQAARPRAADRRDGPARRRGQAAQAAGGRPPQGPRRASSRKLRRHDDPRAAAALAQVKQDATGPGVVRPLITEGAASTVPSAWQQAAAADGARGRGRRRRRARRCDRRPTTNARRPSARTRWPPTAAGCWRPSLEFHDTARRPALPGLRTGHPRRRLGAGGARRAGARARPQRVALTARGAATKQARSALLAL